MPTGTSGTVLNVDAGDPSLADERRADQIDRDAIALQNDDQARERFAAVRDEVRGARQRDGQNRRDRLRDARPSTPPDSLAGFASNVTAGHAFCSVVSREGSRLGSSTLTLAMFASEP